METKSLGPTYTTLHQPVSIRGRLCSCIDQRKGHVCKRKAVGARGMVKLAHANILNSTTHCQQSSSGIADSTFNVLSIDKSMNPPIVAIFSSNFEDSVLFCCFVQMFMAFTHMVLRAKKQSQNRAEREREREKDTVNINAQRDRDRRKRGKKCC